ncbi:MAG: alpha/beta hydrolase [Bradyrhizobium sp.]|nr:alpha/beta hydrolase [Bradyrhizobium sp.]
MNASAHETKLGIGAIDAVLTAPAQVPRPPVALLIAGSGPTDRDGNGPQIKPATLKKLSEALVARGIATLRYDKRGANGWKPEFGRIEDFRFKDFVDDATTLVAYLRDSGEFSRVVVIGHSEGGLVAILASRRASVDRLVLLTTTARRQGDLVKEQLGRQVPPEMLKPIADGIDAIMAGRIVDPLPPGLNIPPALQPSFASAFTEEPIPPLKLLTQPMMIAAGGRDRQVPRQDFDALAVAAPKAETLWLPDMNHVLVDVSGEADDLAAYNQPERALNARLVDAVTAFVLRDSAAK